MGKLAKDLMQGMKNAVKYLDGKKWGSRKHVVHVPDFVDVGALRKKLNMTQKRFAERYGFTLSAVRDWEQKRRTPERAARILLKVIEHNPSIVDRALAA